MKSRMIMMMVLLAALFSAPRMISAQEASSDNLLASQETDISSGSVTPADSDPEKMLREYYADTILPVLGEFRSPQSGQMYEKTDAWMNPQGVMSAVICDLDGDGSPEMLVLSSEKSAQHPDERYNYEPVARVYETGGDGVVQTSEMVLKAWNDYGYLGFGTAYSDKESLMADIVRVNGRSLIVFKEVGSTAAFGDAGWFNFWMLEYTGSSLVYAGSFTQNAAGSSDFEYTGYMFENGELTRSELYYSEYFHRDQALYTTRLDDAAFGFASQFGISVNRDSVGEYYAVFGVSLMDGTNDMTHCFDFECFRTDGYGSKPYEFAVTLDSTFFARETKGGAAGTEIPSNAGTEAADPGYAVNNTDVADGTGTPDGSLPPASEVKMMTIYCGLSVPQSHFDFPDNSERKYSKSEFNEIFAGNAKERYFKSQAFIDEIFVRYGYDFSGSAKAPGKAVYGKYIQTEWYRTAIARCPSSDQATLIYSYMNPVEIYNIELVNAWQDEVGYERFDDPAEISYTLSPLS